MATAYVGLGTNLGDRDAHLRAAVRALAARGDVAVTTASRVYETAPLGPPGQGPYLNAVVRIETELPPAQLLAALQEIEAARGRDRSGARWGPRTLDLDLLLYGEELIDEPALRVPHPHLHERTFVLEPLAELAPELVHPTLGRSIGELALALRDPQSLRLWPRPLPLP